MSRALSYLVKSAMEKCAKKWVWRLLPMLQHMSSTERKALFRRMGVIPSRSQLFALPRSERAAYSGQPGSLMDIFKRFNFLQDMETVRNAEKEMQRRVSALGKHMGVDTDALKRRKARQRASVIDKARTGRGIRKPVKLKSVFTGIRGREMRRQFKKFRRLSEALQLRSYERIEPILQSMLAGLDKTPAFPVSFRAKPGAKPVPVSALPVNPKVYAYRGVGEKGALGKSRTFVTGYPQVALKYSKLPTKFSKGDTGAYVYQLRTPKKTLFTPHFATPVGKERVDLLRRMSARLRRGGTARTFGRTPLGNLPFYEAVFKPPIWPEDVVNIYRVPNVRRNLKALSMDPKLFMKQVGNIKLTPVQGIETTPRARAQLRDLRVYAGPLSNR